MNLKHFSEAVTDCGSRTDLIPVRVAAEVPSMDWKDASEIVSNFATAAALFVAGLWTYVLFVRQRLGYPRLQSTIVPEVFDSTTAARLIRVEVLLENVSTVVVELRSAELRLRQVIPLPPNVASSVAEGYDPVANDEPQIVWPMLAGRRWYWPSGALEIEPGESECLHAEFFVPKELEVVEFYLFVANQKKLRKALGWSRSQLWRVPEGGEEPMADAKLVEKSSSIVPLQGRQQKQQVAQQPQQQVQPRQPQGSESGTSEKK